MLRTILLGTVGITIGITATLSYQTVFTTQVQQVIYQVQACPEPVLPDVFRPVETTHQPKGQLYTAPILGEKP